MLAASTSTHDILLIIAVIVFFITGALHAWAKDLTGTLLCIGLAVFAWAFLITP